MKKMLQLDLGSGDIYSIVSYAKKTTVMSPEVILNVGIPCCSFNLL
ncbi:hypothetical protein DCAR_0206851 [Daucus carota subsp. sativus]|uniref:Uncharacterized protein n=1 Tax=Daucus carota subsp. sativus TaxID=79200 RepID=A0AAF0WE12_DAUCS|nr:hypothetical protein DCAR_0206851 [Daucus carota subsp. sativus]